MATFLLEVGTEELPAKFVADALKQWELRIPASLAERHLGAEVEVYGTPRRLAVLIRNLPTQQPDQVEEVKGPSVQAAFKDGQPTKAVEGFAQKQGVSVDSLEKRQTEKGEFVFARKTILGRATAEVLTELVPTWIFNLEGKRFMRWGDGDLRFSRPIRWVVALLDEAVLPLAFQNGSSATITSDRISRGHRVLHPDTFVINHAQDYVETLEKAFVMVRPEARQAVIHEQVQARATEIGGVAEIDADLLQEVIHLVEWPTAVVGKFDTEFLELPSEVVITEMVTHQRYFAVRKAAGLSELLPNFITISNGDPAKSEIIGAGNERVIRARLSDGQFFYKADRAQPLSGFVPQLEKVTFQEALGSMRDKADRIVAIANLIADQLSVTAEELGWIQLAALLCKADLVTQMVGEFPELQGIMGEKYARASGEPEAVAVAIAEHYLPKGAYDELPASLVGQVVGLSDRLDTLVGIFGLGMIPTGSSDPFALRRAANAVVNIAWSKGLTINLQTLLQAIAHQVFSSKASVFKLSLDELIKQLQDFFLQRIRSLLEEQGIDYDLINAVLGEDDPEYTERALQNLLDVQARAKFLQSIRNNGLLGKVYETVNRASRLSAQGDLGTADLDPSSLVKPALFQQPSEQAFYDALVKLVPQTQAAQASRNYQQLVDGLAAIAPTVSNFFDGEQSVLVMDSDLDIRRNRLNLLGLLRNHARVLADFGAIVKS